MSLSTESLKIGIDARAATEVSAGRGRVVRELLRAFAERDDSHRYRCFARCAWDGLPADQFSWELIAAPDPLWHVIAARAASRACDVFLSTNSYLTVPLIRKPVACMVHDMIAFDPSAKPNRRSAAIERLTLRPAVHSAASLVCVSQATADALIAHFPRAAPKVTVAPLGVSPSVPDADRGGFVELPSPGFVLAVGTLEPRKNLPRLVAAYKTLPQALQERHPLVVVGPRGWRTGETNAAISSLGSRCVYLGHVSDAALTELYRRCCVFCYPSLSEGFGLPVLEAMAAGAPVLTSCVSSLPEVAGPAAEYVDPLSVSDIATGLIKLLTSPGRRTELAALAIERAQSFTWTHTASVLIDTLERLARHE